MRRSSLESRRAEPPASLWLHSLQLPVVEIAVISAGNKKGAHLCRPDWSAEMGAFTRCPLFGASRSDRLWPLRKSHPGMRNTDVLPEQWGNQRAKGCPSLAVVDSEIALKRLRRKHSQNFRDAETEPRIVTRCRGRCAGYRQCALPWCASPRRGARKELGPPADCDHPCALHRQCAYRPSWCVTAVQSAARSCRASPASLNWRGLAGLLLIFRQVLATGLLIGRRSPIFQDSEVHVHWQLFARVRSPPS